MDIVAFICGLVGFIPLLGIVPAIIGVVFGTLTKATSDLGLTGFICSIIALVWNTFIIVGTLTED